MAVLRKRTFYSLLFAVVLLVLGLYLWVHAYSHDAWAERVAGEYRAALEKYEKENLHYSPEDIIHAIRIRQNPSGYFVNNPDLIFEPSELGRNTMKATRFSVMTLGLLNSTNVINRRAVVDYVMGNYAGDIEFGNASSGYINKDKGFAAFRSTAGAPPGVRTTLDALMVLEQLDALDDPRLNLDKVKNFILAHQNPDGGFWDEDYPEDGKTSTLKSTSFAMRALGRINQHQGKEFSPAFKNSVAGFVRACLDWSDGGYADRPGGESTESYGTFRAFISLWWLGGNDDVRRREFVDLHMDMENSIRYLFEFHCHPDTGGFCRFEDRRRGRESLKATHLAVWVLKDMGEETRLDRDLLVRYAAAQEFKPGQYGNDIYSTYAAVMMLTRLDAPTRPMMPPEKPLVAPLGYPRMLPLAFVVFGILGIGMSYMFDKRAREMEESEEKFGNLIEAVPVGITISSPEGRHIEANSHAWNTLGGYDSKEEFLSLPVSTLYHDPQDRERFLELINEKGSVRDFEFQIRRKDGSTLWASLSSIRQATRAGTQFINIIQDITERRKIREEYLKTQKLESMGVLAGGIAHDFNNLLTGVFSNVSLAKLYMSPEGKAYAKLEKAEKALARTKDLTQQFLTFAKGGVPLRTTLSLPGIIYDSATLALSGSNVKYEFALAGDLWPVEADEGQLSQAIQNIVINADEAMPEGGTLRVAAENITIGSGEMPPLKGGRYVKISFEDQGTGIPERHFSKIFDPYFSTKQKGSGLGLTSAYSIIKNHDGLIDVESKTGVGTALHVFLPASENAIQESAVHDESPPVGGGRVLVMDDEEIVRESVEAMLTEMGYDVEVAKNGEEAVETYRTSKEAGKSFDAVLLDLTVPGGMGGEETVKKLREIDHDVKAIVSSGYSNDPVMADYNKYDFKGVLVKPYQLEEMCRVLHAVITGNGE